MTQISCKINRISTPSTILIPSRIDQHLIADGINKVMPDLSIVKILVYTLCRDNTCKDEITINRDENTTTVEIPDEVDKHLLIDGVDYMLMDWEYNRQKLVYLKDERVRVNIPKVG